MSFVIMDKSTMMVLVGLPLLLLVLAACWVGSALLEVDGHASARGNPLNLLVARSIVPRAQGRVGVWQRDELEPRVQALLDDLTGPAQGWKTLRDDYVAWEAAHADDAAPLACQVWTKPASSKQWSESGAVQSLAALSVMHSSAAFISPAHHLFRALLANQGRLVTLRFPCFFPCTC